MSSNLERNFEHLNKYDVFGWSVAGNETCVAVRTTN